MRKISPSKVSKMRSLRMGGYSIPEIARITSVGKTTVQRYVKEVEIPEELKRRLSEKQGGVKSRALSMRANVLREASGIMHTLRDKSNLLLLVGLYWGEGAKRDFGIINSDPHLIQTYIIGIKSLGVAQERITLSLRVHSDIDINEEKRFWIEKTGLSKEAIRSLEIVKGRKKGRLKYGMCRVRVCSGIRERLFIQSLIFLIGKESEYKLVSQ